MGETVKGIQIEKNKIQGPIMSMSRFIFDINEAHAIVTYNY